ncbi:hypothetical protein LNTAR_02939, partial [Lentisphaera araneosa HTCC2155]
KAVSEIAKESAVTTKDFYRL